MAPHQHRLMKIVEKLDADPLTHLMLGHRELFHSNLLAWFFDCLQDESDKVFGRLTKSDTTGKTDARSVTREKKRLDLYFQWPNRRPLVIENKVFSLPVEAQLERYTKENGGKNACFCLLSLSNPNWKDDQREIGHHKWHWLSFEKLAELIRSALPPENPSYELDPMRHYSVETMRHYAEVVDQLHKLAAEVAVMNSNETVGLPVEVKTALKDHRLISSMAKLRASFIEQRIRESLRTAGIKCRNVETNMTRSESLIEWFRSINDDWEAGWQVQHDQFRLAIRVKKANDNLRGDNRKAQREAFAGRNEELFNFLNLDDALGTGNKDVSKFCHYNPDFVYRYKKVPDLRVHQLEAAAVAIAQRQAAIFP